MKMTIAKLVGLLLLLPTSGALISLVIVYGLLADADSNAHFIYLASRQLNRAEQIGSYVHMVHQLEQTGDREPLRQLIAEFDRSFTHIAAGGKPGPRLRSSFRPSRIRSRFFRSGTDMG